MMTIDKTPASATPETRALLPTWLAYPAAGLSFVAAAYLLTSIPAFLALYADLGVDVPGLVKLQLRYPRLLPLGMIALGLLVLLGTRGRIAAGRNARASHALSGVGAVGLVLFSILMVLMNAMTVRTLQRMAGEEDTFDERHLEQRLAWTKNLPKQPTARAVASPGKGNPVGKTNMFGILPVGVRVEILGKSLGREVDVSKDVAARTLDAEYRWHLIPVTEAAELACRVTGCRLIVEDLVNGVQREHWRVRDRVLPALPKQVLATLELPEDTRLSRVAQRITEQTGRPVRLHPSVRGFELQLVSRAIPYWELLWVITTMTGTDLERAKDGSFTIRKGSPAPASFVNLRVRETPVREALERVRGVTGLQITCDPSLATRVVPIDLERVPTGEVPEALARLVNAHVARSKGGAIRLTSR